MGSKILDRILDDIKSSMKSRDRETLTTLRTLHSDIKNVGINNQKEITDEDVASVIAKGIKQGKDAIEQYKAAERSDLVEKEQKEIDIYRKYRPKQLDVSEIEKLADKIIADLGASSKKDMGSVMKEMMPLVMGKADGKIVSRIVSEKLS